MSLLSFSNIAGPSRLPLQVTVTACRRAVAARFYATEAQEPQEPLAAEQSEQSAPVDELSALTLDPSTPATRSGLEKREGRIFYRDWLRYEGEQFRVPQKGQKAKWLGGNVVRSFFGCCKGISLTGIAALPQQPFFQTSSTTLQSYPRSSLRRSSARTVCRRTLCQVQHQQSSSGSNPETEGD